MLTYVNNPLITWAITPTKWQDNCSEKYPIWMSKWHTILRVELIHHSLQLRHIIHRELRDFQSPQICQGDLEIGMPHDTLELL